MLLYSTSIDKDNCLWYCSVEIDVVDPESGIRSITYRIIEDINDIELVKGVAEVKTRFTPGTKRRFGVRNKQL